MSAAPQTPAIDTLHARLQRKEQACNSARRRLAEAISEATGGAVSLEPYEGFQSYENGTAPYFGEKGYTLALHWPVRERGLFGAKTVGAATGKIAEAVEAGRAALGLRQVAPYERSKVAGHIKGNAPHDALWLSTNGTEQILEAIAFDKSVRRDRLEKFTKAFAGKLGSRPMGPAEQEMFNAGKILAQAITARTRYECTIGPSLSGDGFFIQLTQPQKFLKTGVRGHTLGAALERACRQQKIVPGGFEMIRHGVHIDANYARALLLPIAQDVSPEAAAAEFTEAFAKALQAQRMRDVIERNKGRDRVHSALDAMQSKGRDR